ncbi:1524_t:CDS:1, partial [Ambispora leptoticha]
ESKQWDDIKKLKVVGLHVAKKARVWVHALMKTSMSWSDLKGKMEKAAKMKYHAEEKVARLMRIKQEENESVDGYSN